MSIKQGGNTIAGAVGKYPLNEHNISNCITNIPQDIKLELNNGTLTLKAGSKVYVPNGAGVFDEVVIAGDLSVTPTWLNNNTGVVFYYLAENRITATETSYCVSGSTEPTYLDGGCWYDTTNNKIKKGTSSSWTDTQKISLPIAVVKSSSNSITSIDQTFNGFGYIGSTVFALPGVKGLIPNGRNADGSLKNIETEITSVQTYTYTGTPAGIPSGELYAGITSSGVIELNGIRTYNEVENFIYNGVDLELVCEFAKYRNPSGKIANFTLKTAYHALDWNDSPTISGWAMPSNRYIDLTLGASGATYTAPADGYVCIRQAILSNGFLQVDVNAISYVNALSINSQATWCIPVRKGVTYTIYYSNRDATFANAYLRFYYANGAQ